MRNSAIAILAVAAFGLAADPASAKTFAIAYVSAKSLKASCAKGGGYSTGGELGGNYGCVKACGKRGQSCEVDCNPKTKTCKGTTPTRVGGGQSFIRILTVSPGVATPAKPPKPGGLFGGGILDNGPVLGSQGPASAGAPVSAPPPPAAPSPPPIIIR